MANLLELALKSGLKANDEIGASFARMGTSSHPRGFVLTAYRNANRAMRHALGEQNKIQAVQEVMAGLRTTLTADLRSEIQDMGAFGQEEAARQLRFYGVKTSTPTFAVGLSEQVNTSVDALMAKVAAQESMLKALVVAEASDAEILGSDERAGILRASEILAGAAYWTAALVWAGFAWFTSRQQGYQFDKQAIAAIDERTTECCLKVHGQVQPLKGKFVLTGQPRFDQKMDWPGFHYYCRTSAVLYDAQYDDGLTAEMQAAADRLMRERAAGKSGYRHPADARS